MAGRPSGGGGHYGHVPPDTKAYMWNTYVAPSILFTENNVISEDMFRPNPDKKPSTSNLVGCILQVSRSARVTLIVGKVCQIKC